MAARLYQAGPKRRQEIGRRRFAAQGGRIIGYPEKNPFQNPPPYEKLVGDLTGAYSRRINVQHRLVYQVLEQDHVVKVIRMWTHYE
jgi:toxin YoeB